MRTEKSIAFVLESVSATFLLGKERGKDTEAALSFPENCPHVKLHREERGKKKRLSQQSDSEVFKILLLS